MSKLDKLLRELCPNGVEYKKLGEIATISRGGNFQKKDFLTEGVPCIHYGQVYTKYGLFTDKTFTFISEECAKKQKMAQPNDIVMAVTSENIEDVCKCLAWLGDEPVAVSGHSAIIHHNQNAKYLVYYFHSQMFFSQKRKLNCVPFYPSSHRKSRPRPAGGADGFQSGRRRRRKVRFTSPFWAGTEPE